VLTVLVVLSVKKEAKLSVSEVGEVEVGRTVMQTCSEVAYLQCATDAEGLKKMEETWLESSVLFCSENLFMVAVAERRKR